jgi:Bacterial Ig-like domain (group 3)/FG-GAP-like repeat/FG-GAP repeat
MFANIALIRRLGIFFLLLALSSASWATGGLFQSPQSYNSSGWDANSMAVADLNGDGKLDLVVGHLEGGPSCTAIGVEVGVLLGNGDGTFQTAQPYCIGSGGYSSIFIADVNSDGKPDVIVASQYFSVNDLVDGGVAVLLGNGDGTFQPAQSFKSGGGGANFVTVADLNGDGKPDMVVANCSKVGEDCTTPPWGFPTGNVGVLLGNGDGTFQPAVVYDTGGSIAVSVAAADVNGDGELDLIVAHSCVTGDNCGDGAIGILAGNGTGTFQAAVAYNWHGERPFSMVVADVNHDGKLDLLVGGIFMVGVALGNGDGTFQDAVSYATGGDEALSVASGDVNGDGVPDLVVGSHCRRSSGRCNAGSIGVLVGNGDGTFRAPKVFTSDGQVATSIALADVNRDGRLDLIVANMCASGDRNCSHGAAAVFLNASFFRTTTSLTSSLNPSKFGQTVTFTATVTPSEPDALLGRVRFWDGTKSLGAGNVNGGVATLTKSTLAIGTHSITAQYLGDSSDGKSTSSAVEQTVQ